MSLPALPNATPSWLVRGTSGAVALVALVLAVWHPNRFADTPAAQALVFFGGLLIASFIYAIHLLVNNGFTKAGLERTLSEEETWVKENFDTLKTTFEAAKPALDAIPGVPTALEQASTRITTLEARVNALPVDQMHAFMNALNLPATAAASAAPVVPPTSVAPPAPPS